MNAPARGDESVEAIDRQVVGLDRSAGRSGRPSLVVRRNRSGRPVGTNPIDPLANDFGQVVEGADARQEGVARRRANTVGEPENLLGHVAVDRGDRSGLERAEPVERHDEIADDDVANRLFRSVAHQDRRVGGETARQQRTVITQQRLLARNLEPDPAEGGRHICAQPVLDVVKLFGSIVAEEEGGGQPGNVRQAPERFQPRIERIDLHRPARADHRLDAVLVDRERVDQPVVGHRSHGVVGGYRPGDLIGSEIECGRGFANGPAVAADHVENRRAIDPAVGKPERLVRQISALPCRRHRPDRRIRADLGEIDFA